MKLSGATTASGCRVLRTELTAHVAGGRQWTSLLAISEARIDVGDYDLTRMGWQQFEHMVQALAKEELGSGVRPFGAGRDGQRDATFNGAVDFPRGAGPTWNGYGVIQMKFKHNVTSTTDGWHWFLDEVRKEVRGWLAKKRVGEKTPKYLLFATNVVLSGTHATGGKDQFDRYMDSAGDELDLDDWYVWDYDEIRTMLDMHTNVRQRYFELIVTGDFLLKLDSFFSLETALEIRQLAGHAVSELVNRQWVRTGDAGYSDTSKVRLADIAIDLPCDIEWAEGDPADRDRTMTAETVIGIGDRNLANGFGSGATAAVIVGGPGQGKSTICQVIAHAYRVAFLADTDIRRHGATAVRAYDDLAARLRDAGIPSPQRRRWPFVVELAKVGSSIAAAKGPFSLLSYIADSIDVAGRTVDPSALLEWMRSWPVCLVLDGLDEIPNARERTKLMDAVRTLVSDLSAAGVDLFVVATTRPQGYRGEFREAIPCTELDLLEFTEEEALDYSDALTRLRSADDPDLAIQVSERLIEAVHERVTQRLMTTPLQVTIMTALAEEAVDLPSDRFELFDRYYRVIYDRELAKSEAFSELKSLRPHVDHLHEQAGLKLQARSERAGNSDASITKNEMARILRRRLTRTAGYDEGESDSLADTLMKLSTDRLVMLVSRKSSQYQFEVRSLQEYMAARALTEGDGETILANLLALAPSTHWRNTWLLAAGRVFKRQEHLIDRLIDMVATYDSTSADTPIALIGAGLAGDLYVDNLGTEFPGVRRRLLKCAISQFADTTASAPRSLQDLLDLALTQSTKEVNIALEALHELSRDNSSCLATLVLSQNNTGMSDLAKQARTTLTEGRTYIKPPPRHVDSLARELGHVIEDTPAAVLLVEELTRTDSRMLVESQLTISTDLWNALERKPARLALARTVTRTLKRDPAIAALGRLLLKFYASRVPQGQPFAK